MVFPVSDVSVRSYNPSGGADPTNWYTPGFSDATWSLVGLWAADPMIVGAQRIWNHTGAVLADEACLFRQHFTLDALPTTPVPIAMLINDTVEGLYVNGNVIGWSPSGTLSISYYSIPTSAFVVGENILAVRVANTAGTSQGDAWVSWQLQVDATPSTPTYCVYGTELNDPGTFVYYLTPGLVDLVLASAGVAWLIPFATSLYFTAFRADILCTIGQPPAPMLTLEDLVPPNFEKIHDAFEAAAWPFFCQCKTAPPGQPAPVSPPGPSLPEPTGLPPVGTYTLDCDGVDVCTVLNQLMFAVGGLTQQMALVRRDVELIQRQDVPFAYIPSVRHNGLSGAGTFDVVALIGLSVEVTSAPSWLTSDMSVPAQTYSWGWITLGTSDGYQRKITLTHNPQLVLPISGAFTKVAYTLGQGVIADIVELVREP
jgi:hypothetical protein